MTTPAGPPIAAHTAGDVRARADVRYDVALVEEAVLRAEAGLADGERLEFRAERDRLYPMADADVRDAAFEELHGRWFVRLGLDRPVHEALVRFPSILTHVIECRVTRAVSGRDELADLVSDRRADRGATLLVRLRPESLLDPARLTGFLDRELMHVADMIDPAFGYSPALPKSEEGPTYDRLLTDRYRVVWDVTVDGRLARLRWAGGRSRAACLAEFARTFPMLGDVESAFERWFGAGPHDHATIASFVRDPAAVANSACERRERSP